MPVAAPTGNESRLKAFKNKGKDTEVKKLLIFLLRIFASNFQFFANHFFGFLLT